MAPKRNNRSSSSNSTDALLAELEAGEFTPFSGRRYRLGQDGVLRDDTAVAHIEVHESDDDLAGCTSPDDPNIDEHLETLKNCQATAAAWIKFIPEHPHIADLRDAILIFATDIACMVSRLKATMTTVKGEVREVIQRWLELSQTVLPFLPAHVHCIHPCKRAREDDDVAPSRPVPAGVQDAHSDIEPETYYYKMPSASSENEPDSSSRHHIKDEHE